MSRHVELIALRAFHFFCFLCVWNRYPDLKLYNFARSRYLVHQIWILSSNPQQRGKVCAWTWIDQLQSNILAAAMWRLLRMSHSSLVCTKIDPRKMSTLTKCSKSTGFFAAVVFMYCIVDLFLPVLRATSRTIRLQFSSRSASFRASTLSHSCLVRLLWSEFLFLISWGILMIKKINDVRWQKRCQTFSQVQLQTFWTSRYWRVQFFWWREVVYLVVWERYQRFVAGEGWKDKFYVLQILAGARPKNSQVRKSSSQKGRTYGKGAEAIHKSCFKRNSRAWTADMK